MTNNGNSAKPHRVVIYAESNEGQLITESEIREIQSYLESKGFSGNTNIVRPSFLERIGRRAFG